MDSAVGPPEEYARQLRTDLGLGSDPDSLHRARHVHLRNARPRAKVLITVAAIACGAVIAALVWVNRVEPLTFADIVIAPGGRTLQAGAATEHQWRWRRDRRFAIGSYLRNGAAVPVRVTAFTLPHISVPWDNWRVTLARDENDHAPDHDRRFTPFALDPGEGQLVWFRGKFARCPTQFAPGGGLGISDIDTTFKILGLTRREKLPLGFTYSVKLGNDCPPPA